MSSVNRPTRLLLAGVLLLALAASAEAQALRCGSRLISRGDSSAKLLRYCGEPETVSSHVEQVGLFAYGRFYPGFLREVLVEDWTYNFGPRKLMRRVRVVDGIVEDIDLLGYGYSAP